MDDIDDVLRGLRVLCRYHDRDAGMTDHEGVNLLEAASAATQKLEGLREIVEGFAAIDPAPEAARCVSCEGVAEPSEWEKWGHPPGNPDPPDTAVMVFVPRGPARYYGFWHEPDCAWLRAWQMVGDTGA